jgi:hypothetical protein
VINVASTAGNVLTIEGGVATDACRTDSRLC